MSHVSFLASEAARSIYTDRIDAYMHMLGGNIVLFVGTFPVNTPTIVLAQCANKYNRTPVIDWVGGRVRMEKRP